MSEAVHALEIGAPPGAVWAALVDAEPRHWYYGLAARGEFAAGQRVRWMRPGGEDAMEESDVLDVEAGRRLVLRTRFLFAPHYAAAPPHTITWTLAAAPAGTRVELAVSGQGPGARLLEEEGDLVLRTLRIALDPAAQREFARLEEVGPVEVRDVTPDRVADYQGFFDHDAFRDYPAWQACYCMEPHRDPAEESTRAQNRADMSDKLARGRATALLAYAGGRPVGWCQYGETTALAGIMHRFQLEAGDHEGVGSIACFVVAAPYRGHGVASRLLSAALERMRARGLRAVEAYPPADPGSAQSSFRGPRRLYEAAGFEVVREAGPSLVMRKSL